MNVPHTLEDEVVEIASAAISMYGTWMSMRGRCTNPRDKAYHNYGGRGICVEWDNFEQFFRDMYPTFQKGLTLDRINNDGNYSYDNCQWATATEQANNRRTNRMVTISEVTKTVAQWCEIFGVSTTAAHNRISTFNWDPIEAVTAKVAPRGLGICTQGHPFDYRRKDGKGFSCQKCRKIKTKEGVSS